MQTDGSEYALKEALYTKGPMTVSVDAGPDSFVFYSSGIYNNSACKSDYKGEHLLTAHVLSVLQCLGGYMILVISSKCHIFVTVGTSQQVLATFNMFFDMQHRSVSPPT